MSFQEQIERFLGMVESLRNIPVIEEEEKKKKNNVIINENSPPAFPEFPELKELKGPISNTFNLFIRPRSSWITPIWYYYSVELGSWLWTPYDPLKRTHEEGNYIFNEDEDLDSSWNKNWIKVPDLFVRTGFYNGSKPAKPNIDIINFLNKYKAVPKNLTRVCEKIRNCKHYKDIIILCLEEEEEEEEEEQ